MNYQPPFSSPSVVAAAAVSVSACSDIVTHLKNGRILCLTSLPPALISQQLPGVTGDQMGGLAMWPRQPEAPGAPLPVTVPLAALPPPSGRPRKKAVDSSRQNPRLKAAWTVTDHPNLCREISPFCDATQPANRQAVVSLNTPALLICLSVALRGRCFSACMQSRAPLSAWDKEHVAQLGGLAL